MPATLRRRIRVEQLQREQESFHRYLQRWDTDGQAAYRERHGLPAVDTCDT